MLNRTQNEVGARFAAQKGLVTRALGASIADSGAEAQLARVLRNHGVPAPEHHHLVRHGQVIIAEL